MSSTLDDLYSKVVDDDSIGAHDWGDDTDWTNPAGDGHSEFVIKPKDGQTIILTEAWVKFDANVDMQSPFEVRYCVGDLAVRTTLYKNLSDFVDRFGKFERLNLAGVNGYEHDILFWRYKFDKEVVLWSSGGFEGGSPVIVDGVPTNMFLDGDGRPKLTKVVLKIQDDTPYKNKDAGAISMARVRYPGSVICEDPDWTE